MFHAMVSDGSAPFDILIFWFMLWEIPANE